MIKPSETSDILQQQLDNVDLKAEFEEIGTVLEAVSYTHLTLPTN